MTCSDSARPATVDCTRYIQHDSVVAHLCAGVVRIQSARCAELSEVAFLQSVIEHVGLTKDKRAEWLYGSAAQFMIKSTGSDKRYMRGGLWQEPLQLAPALAAIGALAAKEPIRSYVEVGVFSAWTCVLVSAYLRRFAVDDSIDATRAATFRAAAVDIDSTHIARETHTLMRELNVSFVPRKSLSAWLGGGTRRERRVGLCFIDGDHSYDGVRNDYEEMAPDCRSMLFHDIQDTTTLLIQRQGGGGGVPSFWRQLTRSIRPARLASFTSQHSTAAKQFGIGLVTHGKGGTAEPDDADAFDAWGRGLVAWTSFCALEPALCRETECRFSRRCHRAWIKSPNRGTFFTDNETWYSKGRPLTYGVAP